MRLLKTEALIKNGIKEGLMTNAAVSVGNAGGEIGQVLQDDGETRTKGDTLFDMASVTKLMAAATVSWAFIKDGKLFF